jgi:hypothetical protein
VRVLSIGRSLIRIPKESSWFALKMKKWSWARFSYRTMDFLVCSLIFMFLRKLSQLDIVFAIAAVHSPIFHMLLLESIGFLTSRQYASRFHHFGSLRLPGQLLIIGIIPLWIVLSGINVLDFPIVERIHQEDRPLAIPQLGIVEWLVRLIFELFSAYFAQFSLFLSQKLTLLDSDVAIYSSLIIISMIYGTLMTLPFLIWIVSITPSTPPPESTTKVVCSAYHPSCFLHSHVGIQLESILYRGWF